MLCPWTSSSRRQQNSKDYSLPLGYYWVRRAPSAAAATAAAAAAAAVAPNAPASADARAAAAPQQGLRGHTVVLSLWLHPPWLHSLWQVVRGWRVPTILDVVCKGMTPLQLDVAHGRTAEVRARAAAAAQALVSGDGDARAREFSDALAERSKPYRASLLHLAVFSGELALLKVGTRRARRANLISRTRTTARENQPGTGATRLPQHQRRRARRLRRRRLA